MSFQDDVNTARTKLQSDLRGAANQAAVDAAYATFFLALVGAEENNPGNSCGALSNLIRFDASKNSRGHKG